MSPRPDEKQLKNWGINYISKVDEKVFAYMENPDEVFKMIVAFDDEERHFEIKSRVRERNQMIVAYDKLEKEVKRLRKKMEEKENGNKM